MRKFIDITLSLENGLASWPSDVKPEIRRVASFENGDGFAASDYHGSLHWGTHLDAPFHFNPDGWTVAQIPLEILIGPCEVVDCRGAHAVSGDLLNEKITGQYPRILLKTDNSDLWRRQPGRFRENFVSLTADAADVLLEKNIQLVGIDYMSLDFFDSADYPVHQKLYARNVVGVENLNLLQIDPGFYRLICLPLKIKGGDGSPARAILSEM